MPYQPANFQARLKLADGRWVDAEAFWGWLMTAKTKNLSVVKERRDLLTSLRETYISEVAKVQMDGTSMRIDTASAGWHDDFLVFQSFLSDRSQAEHKPGQREHDRADETVRTDNNLSRAWKASLERAREKIVAGRELIDHDSFTVGLRWDGN
jgi:hypothetical protein